MEPLFRYPARQENHSSPSVFYRRPYATGMITWERLADWLAVIGRYPQAARKAAKGQDHASTPQPSSDEIDVRFRISISRDYRGERQAPKRNAGIPRSG